MLTLSKNPPSSEQIEKLRVWLGTKEADLLAAIARAQMARIQVEAINDLARESEALMSLRQVSEATIEKLTTAGRLGVFLEVLADFQSGKIDLSLIRIDAT